MSKTKKMILSALLLALTIVLSRFLSINTTYLVIGFSFAPIAITGYLLGPKYAAIVSGLADLIGAILFPFGPYFIGFTISALIRGLIFGLILYKKEGEHKNKELIIRIIIACFIELLFIDILMNGLWLKIIYKEAFLAVISTRIVEQSIMFPVQVITIFTLIKALQPIIKRYLYQEE